MRSNNQTVGRLHTYRNVEHAVFDLIAKSLDWESTHREEYVVYAPSGVNYKVLPARNEFGALLVRRRHDRVWKHLAVGELWTKKPERPVEKRVVYFHLDDVYAGYEAPLGGDGFPDSVFRVERLGREREHLRDIPLFYRHVFGGGSFYLMEGKLDGRQKEYFARKGARIMARAALENIVEDLISPPQRYRS